MPALNIRIHRCDQKEPAWPGVELEAELQFGNVTIIEHGTNGGKAAVAFTLTDLQTGKKYMAQTTGDLMKTLGGAIKGAEEHWAENPVENVWKK